MAEAQTRRRLVEKHRRRPDFDPADGSSTAVKLADGREWWLARPWLEIIPRFDDGRAVAFDRVVTGGEVLDALLLAVAEARGMIDQGVAVATLGVYLLRRNYDLTDAELSTLFTFRPGDPESVAMLKAIVSAATGRLSLCVGEAAIASPKSPAVG